jgi:hypothetical protein
MTWRNVQNDSGVEVIMNKIETTSINNWFASAWFLERKHPEQWGKRAALERFAAFVAAFPVRV